MWFGRNDRVRRPTDITKGTANDTTTPGAPSGAALCLGGELVLKLPSPRSVERIEKFLFFSLRRL